MSCNAGPSFDDPAEVHHRDPVGHHPGRGQVVGDEQHGHAELPPQPADQVEHGGRQRHVEGAGGLVAEQDLGRDHGGPGQGHPLALAPRELGRPWRSPPPPAARRGRRASRTCRTARPAPTCSSRRRSPTSSPIVIHGVSEAPASWNTIWGRAPRPSSMVPESGLKAGDGPQQRRLPAPALAHQGHRLALADFQVDPAQGLKRLRRNPERRGKVLCSPLTTTAGAAEPDLRGQGRSRAHRRACGRSACRRHPAGSRQPGPGRPGSGQGGQTRTASSGIRELGHVASALVGRQLAAGGGRRTRTGVPGGRAARRAGCAAAVRSVSRSEPGSQQAAGVGVAGAGEQVAGPDRPRPSRPP